MTHTILLIEDNEGDIVLMKEALKEANFQGKIMVIKEGNAAIRFFKENVDAEALSINLVLLDINLPKRNGHEVLKYIKSSPELKHLPVVIFTTSSSNADIEKAYQNFANAFVTKPTDTDEFLEVIAKIQNYWISGI
ncbi:response regulator [Flavobacterium sp. N1994]|uniref:response regulator n=1 Tax=Flavobacterium sp. N1994 TaxID=2986827 RepID=UPI002221B96D|nr:response regulator [Flavobacterium sp. N1994]